MQILFICDEWEDYLADGLLHGLISLPNLDVIDSPRKDILYKGGIQFNDIPDLSVRGGGFTLYGTLFDTNTQAYRSHVRRRLQNGYFDAVVISNVWRQWGFLLQWSHLLSSQPLLLLDGDDDQRFYPRSLARVKNFGVGSGLTRLLELPTTHYFKRELTNSTKLWGVKMKVHPIGFSVPTESILTNLPTKTKLFQSHIVDPDISRKSTTDPFTLFTDEKSYRSDLAASRFGITMRRSGWDCLRHYEIASCGAVLCFRDLHLKPSNCSPHGLIDGLNCISYRSYEDLLFRIESLATEDEISLQYAALSWAKANTTQTRAIEFLCSSGLRDMCY